MSKEIGSGFVSREVDTDGNVTLTTADGEEIAFLSDNQLRDGIATLRSSKSFTLDTYPDGKKLLIANTHATNTITCTLPTGQTMNGQTSFTIIAGKILELELIGSVWIDLNNDYYSTTEQVIGKWIDGKPLYRKVVNFGSLPNAAYKMVEHGISNIDNVTRLEGVASDGVVYFPMPYLPPSNNIYAVSVYISEGIINVETGMDRTSYTAKIIIEYTKTTD